MSKKNLMIIATVAVCVIMPINLVQSSAVLISDLTMSIMVEMTSRHPFCRMHKDRGDIQRMILSSDPRRVRQVPRESVIALEEVCNDAGSHGFIFRGSLGFIYPGTKWCGPGDVAADHNDLGRYRDEDRCCREHDLCPNTLTPGQCHRGLCNSGTFTRSHCDCDARFRRCLQSLNTETANTLGAIFFNVVQVTCIHERSPCSEHQRFGWSFAYGIDNNSNYNCDFDYVRSGLYIPPDNQNFISRIAETNSPNSYPIKNFFSRKLGIDNERQIGDSRSFDDVTTRLGVRLASVGLIAGNLIKEVASFPFKGLAGFGDVLRKNFGNWNSPNGFY